MEFDEPSFGRFVDEGVSLDAKSLHVTVVDRNPHVVVKPSERQQALRVVRAEIEESPWFLNVRFRIRFERADDLGELHRVADEEHREIVADQIEVSFARVEFDGESTGIAEGFGAAALVDDGGESDDDGGLGAGCAEEVGAG